MEGGYSAGNLELSILGFSKKAVASIDVTAKALHRLASAIDKINNTQFVFAGQKLEVLFEKIAKATNSINTKNITNLAGAAKSLSSISKLSNLDKMDFEKIGKGFGTLSVAIQPFLDKVKEAEASLVALDGVLRRAGGKRIQNILNGGADSGKRGGGLFGLTKLGINAYLLRRMGRFAADLVQAGADYAETLNLWQVAMRDNLDVADEFINKMQKAYGISSKTLMNAQAIFKNMIGSLGQISDETAYALSEALVQMSADFSSLYNVKLESAFEKMQSMLAGQVRPIRSAGLDMTETTLYQFYQQIGGTKTMRQLNRTEKQLLSILAVYKQMGSAGALGDMTKTLNSFANQTRMMTQYWAELKTWSGLLLKDLLEDWGIMKYINAALIFVTEIIKAIAQSRGLGEENYLTGMFETVQNTNDEVDELQGKLLDFDKFRALESTGDNNIALDEKLLEAITGYSSKVNDAMNEAQILADEWLKAWGAFKDEEGNIVNISEVLLNIKTSLAEIVGVLASLRFIQSFGNISHTLSNLLHGAGGFSAILDFIADHKLLTGLGILFGLLTSLYFANEDFRNSVNRLFQAFSPLFTVLTKFITLWAEPVIKVLTFVVDLIGNVLSNILISFADVITRTIYAVLLVLTPVLYVVEAILKVISSIFTVLDALLHWNWGQLGNNLGKVWTQWSSTDYAVTTFKGAFGTYDADFDNSTVPQSSYAPIYSPTSSDINASSSRQMEQAFYNALYRHSKDGNGTIVVQAYLDGEKVYENTTSHAKQDGYVWSKA